ncbi:MAG: hypothetical protein ABIG20_02685 [archaeon]
MKSFFDLLKEKNFLLPFLILVIILIFNFIDGFRWYTIMFAAILAAAIGLNLYKTKI